MSDASYITTEETISSRAAAVAGYLLPAPLKWLATKRRAGFVRQHNQQALALSFLMACYFCLAVALCLLSTWLHIRWESTALALGVGEKLTLLLAAALLVWLVGWLACMMLAARGSLRRLPILAALAERRWVRRCGLIGACGIWLIALLITVIGIIAGRVARPWDGRPAPLYVLYDDRPAPRWVVTLVAAPTICAAERHWGDQSTIVAPLAPGSLGDALAHGRLVYVAAHGVNGPALYRDGEITPQDVARGMNIGENLQMVYLSMCHGGDMADQWQAALAPATVISYPRFSAHLEHAVFLWFQAPRIIARQD